MNARFQTSPHYPVVKDKPIILSVRHGESIGNVNRDIYDCVSDPALWLTERGNEQARAAGAFLAQHFLGMDDDQRPRKIRIFRSFYRRAVQTAEHIEAALRDALDSSGVTISVKEDSRLRELEFGYGGYLDEPFTPHNTLADQLRYQGYKFLAPRLGGESPAHMEPRLRLVLDAIYRDFQENSITYFIVVGHGITNRVLTYAFCNKGNDWYEQEPNPDNCAIRLMAEADLGYIFPNAQGQWDTQWEPEEPDAGNDRLNKHGRSFSPAEMEELIALQRSYPDIMPQMMRLMKDKGTTARAALAQWKDTNLPDGRE